MADTNDRKLARRIDTVKQLDPSITLTSENYYNHIRPFLFGNKEDWQITEENTPEGGIRSAVNNGVLISGQKILIKATNSSTTELTTADITNESFINKVTPNPENGIVEDDLGKYLTPSDLVRILTGLARIFHGGDGKFAYNQISLTRFFGTGSEDIHLVENWGKPNETEQLKELKKIDGRDRNFFYEQSFVDNSDKVRDLLREVIQAAYQYEELNKRFDLGGFVTETELKNLLVEDFVPRIFFNFKEFQENIVKKIDDGVENEDFKRKLIEAREEIEKEIKRIVMEDSGFFDQLLSPSTQKGQENLEKFAKREIYYHPEERYLPRKRDQLDGVLESEEYLSEFVPKRIEDFFTDHKESLIRKYIQPLTLVKTEGVVGAPEGDQEIEGGDTDDIEELTEVKIDDFTISLDDFKERFLNSITQDAVEDFSTIYAQESTEENLKIYLSGVLNQNQQLLIDGGSGLIGIKEKITQEIINKFELTDDEIKKLSDANLLLRRPVGEQAEGQTSETTSESGGETEILLHYRIFDQNWYKTKVREALEEVKVSNSPIPEHSNFFDYLYKVIVLPKVTELYEQDQEKRVEEEAPPEEKPPEEELPPEERPEEPERPSGAVVVPPEVITGVVTQQTGKTELDSDSLNKLSTEEVRKLQYEAAWLYNHSVYNLFTAHGLTEQDINQVSPDFLTTLRADIFDHLSKMSPAEVKKLFASPSARQRVINEFQQKFASDSQKKTLITEVFTNLQNSPKYQDLSESQQKALLETGQTFGSKAIVDSTTTLELSLKNIINTDSPVLNKNVQNTVDTLIIQYGINQEFYAQDPETGEVIAYQSGSSKDAIWFIENIPINRLAMIFDLPAGIKLDDDAVVAKLRNILVAYANQRASELAMHIQDIALKNGLVQLSDDEAKKLLTDDETFTRHFNTIQDFRNLVKKSGGETVTGAMEEKRHSNRKKTVREQFKHFVPVWETLTGAEQKIIYQQLNIPVPANFDPGVQKLEFIAEFVFYDISKLKSIRKHLKDKDISDKQRKLFEEALEISDELQREQEMSRLMNEDFQHQLKQEPGDENNMSGYEQVNSELELDLGRETFYLNEEEITIPQNMVDDSSWRENYNADVNLQARGFDTYANVNQGRGLYARASNSRFGKRIKKLFGTDRLKKKASLDKAKKTFNKLMSKGLSKVAAGASSLIIPGSGALLLAIRNEKLRNALSVGILGLLTAIIIKTIHALGSIGGLIGGVIGGALGYALSGGTMVIPGVILGANIGDFIMPTRWWDSVMGGRFQPTQGLTGAGTTGAGVAGAGIAEGVAGAQGLDTSGVAPEVVTISISTGAMVVLGAAGFMMFSTFLTIFVIYSGFLVPVPGSVTGLRSLLPPGQSLCWPTSGYITQVDVPGHTGTHRVNNITQAIDIACAQTKDCPGNNGTVIKPPEIYASHDGVASAIRIMDGYGLHIIIRSPQGYETIYAHMSDTTIPPGSSRRVSRGELLGRMGTTGYSTGIHLHYEYSGGTIRSILPRTPVIPSPSEIPPGELLNIPVTENCSVGGEVPSGYIAIGPQGQDNIITSDSSLVANPQTTCSWRDNLELDVAINGNFWNSPTEPIGFGGSNPTRYYYNAENRGGPEYMGFSMRSLVVDQSGNISIIRIQPEWYNSSTFPIDAPQYIQAVTGLSEFTSDDGDTRRKTAVGIGTANGQCGSFTGPAVFLAAIPQGEWSDLRRLLLYCGVTEYVFMDAGTSGAFCSDTLNMTTTRANPINIGLQNAEVVEVRP
jgi:murein DD-endopeptidase MepM/ murein hydrolase activator NlpD